MIGLLVMVAGASLPAQEGMQFNSRTVKKYVRPVLPETARKMQLKGIVRLEVQVSPSGKVTGIKVLGGHPLLIESATLAVKSWVFAPGAQETAATVALDFQ